MQENRNLTVNFHFATSCNMKCRYCFVEKTDIFSIPDYYQVLEKLAAYFTRVNFVGGEPTTSPYLIPLIKKAKSLGLDCTMVTNGFDMIRHAGKFSELYFLLSTIGISVDSLIESTNNKIGRISEKHAITREEYEELCKKINSHGIQLKINTVVSKLNQDENFSDFYQKTNPDRIKIFQVLKPNNSLKQCFDNLLISNQEFDAFVNRHSSCKQKIIAEDNAAMTNAYFILNSECRFLDNKTGRKSPSLAGSAVSVEEALSHINIDYTKYQARYCA